MALSDEQAEAMAAPGVDLAIFFRLDTVPPVRLWSGAGDFKVEADSIEEAPATYDGKGILQGVPALGALVNGVAERVTFALSGIASDIIQMADSEADAVCNKTVNIGLQPLDSSLQPIGPVLWFRTYQADVLAVDKACDKDGAISRSINLSVGSVFTARRRPLISNWTDADQKRRSADDSFCERTPRYSQGTILTWPRF